jgi:hypothetical protein
LRSRRYSHRDPFRGLGRFGFKRAPVRIFDADDGNELFCFFVSCEARLSLLQRFGAEFRQADHRFQIDIFTFFRNQSKSLNSRIQSARAKLQIDLVGGRRGSGAGGGGGMPAEV